MKTLFLLIFSALASFAFGQIDIKWMYSADDNFYRLKNINYYGYNAILPTIDTGYIILSKTDTITKFDKNNKIIWQKKFTEKNESAEQIVLTDDGGIILWSIQHHNKGKKNYKKNYQIKRIDNHQNILWVKPLLSFNDNYYIGDIAINHQNEIVIVGSFEDKEKSLKLDSDDILEDAYIAKLDAKGDIIWEKKYERPQLKVTELFQRVLIDSSNQIVVLGWQDNEFLDAKNQIRNNIIPILFKYDNDGNVIWNWIPQIETDYEVVSFCENKALGGWGILLTTYNNAMRYSTTIAHISPNGEIGFIKKIAQTSKFDHDGMTILANLDGNYLVAGLKHKQEELLYVPRRYLGESDIWLLEIDAKNGELLWEKTYGGGHDDDFGALIALADMSYLLLGTINYAVGDPPKKEEDEDYRHIVANNWIIRFKELTSQKGKLARLKEEYEIQKKMPKPKIDTSFQRKGNISGIDSVDFEFIVQNLDVDEIDWDKVIKTDYEEYKKVPRIWAVVVGVSDYSDAQNAEGLQDLSYAHTDAQAIYDFLRSPQGGAVPETQMQLITNEKATAKEILAAAEKLFAKAASKDLIIFYFSGHGEMNTFLTYDSDLPHAEIKKQITKSAAGQRLCVADACHSGSWAGRKRYVKDSNNDEELRRMYYENLRIGSDRIALFMSSGYNQLAYEERAELTQGVFTHFYLKGLSGEADANRDNIVSLQELYEYVKRNVSQKTANNTPPQVPQLQGVFDNMMPVGVVKKK
jgi:outer membrane protein assembly factor BamB